MSMSLRGNVHVRDTLVCSSMLRHISNYVHITCLTRYSTRTHTHTHTPPSEKRDTVQGENIWHQCFECNQNHTIMWIYRSKCSQSLRQIGHFRVLMVIFDGSYHWACWIQLYDIYTVCQIILLEAIKYLPLTRMNLSPLHIVGQSVK